MITVWARHEKIKDNMLNDMHLRTSDWNGRSDCEIGDFGLNFFLRPRAATKKDFKGYKNTAALKSAVTQCLKARGFTDIEIEIPVVKTYVCEYCGYEFTCAASKRNTPYCNKCNNYTDNEKK